MNIPENHQSVMPYLILRDIRGFLRFIQDVFDAQILEEHLDEEHRVVHAEVKIGDSTLMMGQANEIWNVNNAGLFIYVKDADIAFNHALKYGAETILELENKEYGRSGGVKDPYGNIWWITSL